MTDGHHARRKAGAFPSFGWALSTFTRRTLPPLLLALLALDGERPLRLGRSGDDPDRAFDALVLFSWCAAEADDPESLVVRRCVVGYPLDASAGGKARRGRVGPVLCRRE